MSIHVALHHRTHYTYDRPVAHAPHLIRLRPAPHSRTPIRSYSLRILPANHFLNWQQDPQGNFLARAVFPEKCTELLVEVDLVAEMTVINPFDFFLEPSAETFPFEYEPWLKQELKPFLETTPQGPKFAEYLAKIPTKAPRTVDFVVGLNQNLSKEIRYLIRLEPGVQTPEQTLEKGSGSCRDSAWLLVQLLRSIGLAARFVSGYLIQLAVDVKSLDGPSGPENDFTDLHAWTEVYLPGAGWVGLDPTSGLLAAEGHIPVAATPDPSSAAPVSGAVDPCESKLDHSMRVKRIRELPRVTKPYTDDQWTKILALGNQVDADLSRDDVRLTMGGEPTFVSIDDMDGAEWNTAALGTRKRELADKLVRKLKRHFAPNGLLHYGQGKWYPGESLPRWALGCYWRRDGLPMWQDERLIADESVNYGHATPQASKLVHRIAQILNLDEKFIIPAHEDVAYYLWKEHRLPINVTPEDARLADPEERAHLAKIFDRGLGDTVGFVLPIRRQFSATDGQGWTSGPWFLRDNRLFLIPGDSPIGFRLPLASLPWVRENDFPYMHPPDPFQRNPALPPPRGRHQYQIEASPCPSSSPAQRGSRIEPEAQQTQSPPPAGSSAPDVIRTALCIEPRNGRIHVFMPPVVATEDYLDLVAAIETAAEQEGIPVVLEGEPPPHDDRLSHIKVTPDPGVIEVNLQPARTWEELVHLTTTLYDEARQTRLGAEKFMIDGRHVGTGGGNHIVLGGETPSDSPLLRRPDLLRSLLAYWQNHPSLSYLFSGLFIGPTSQHPRVDEARHEAVFELETAFAQLPPKGNCPPWLVDRLFRHLLVDVTGNTHRTEFCIDKLYSPDSASGRQGLVELRSFEMPPHPHMSLAQQLLLRALVAKFWKTPYNADLVRWGTILHDRFMLPHFVERDFNDVLADLRTAGFAFEDSWFAPHIEFRFPLYGEIAHQDVHLELRQALEPWHVLGEQGGAGGTVRFVDSSVERLQVRALGITPGRHLIACNGRRVPLHPTGKQTEFVAGVRYRAWQPPNCLHPTVGVHTPLTFDIFDLWNQRSLGGCTYHVMHPGGRSFERFPVNAFEAESRRRSRFFEHGHSPGTRREPPDISTEDYPFTLDLRRG